MPTEAEITAAKVTLAASSRVVVAVDKNASPEDRATFFAAKETLQQARVVNKARRAAEAAAAELARLEGAS
jgi:hypothetical protein